MTFPRLPGRARPFLITAPMILVSAMALAAPKAYVGNFGDNSASVIDTDTNKIAATIPVGQGSHGTAVARRHLEQ